MNEISTASTDSATHDGQGVFLDALCAVNGTHGSFAAVEQATRLLDPHGRLTLLVVTAAGGSGAYRYAQISSAHAERILERATEAASGSGARVETVIDPASPPAQVILDRAAGHDLLAIGAPVGSWLSGMFLGGGVAVEAMGSVKTPLLVARERADAEEPARIVVASDGLEDCDAVVDLAGRLARAQSAQVLLVHAVGRESEAGRLGVEEHRRRLEAATEAPIETRIAPESAWRAIVEASKRFDASLIVMGSRRLDGTWTIGGVGRRVVHEAPCSVLLAPPGA